MRILTFAFFAVYCICVAHSQIADEDGKVIAAIREALGESTLDRDTREFAKFAKGYKRNYKDDKEMLKRFKNFQKNMRNAEQLAQQNPQADFGATQFSDLSYEEFAQTYLTLDASKAEAAVAAAEPVAPASLRSDRGTVLAAPRSIDWTALGKVTPVRNQGNCGCCYAFSALADIEAQLLIKKGRSVSLSPQQVVDCDKGNLGCNGGFYTSVWTYIKNNGGVMLESKYPYKAKKATCAYRTDSTNTQIARTGAVKPASNSFPAIQDFISTRGPASAALDASLLFSYRGGILNKSSGCTSLNHAVLITGYNADQNYFIVKNSWGGNWGEKGYFRMTPSTCLISNYVQGSYTV